MNILLYPIVSTTAIFTKSNKDLSKWIHTKVAPSNDSQTTLDRFFLAVGYKQHPFPPLFLLLPPGQGNLVGSTTSVNWSDRLPPLTARDMYLLHTCPAVTWNVDTSIALGLHRLVNNLVVFDYVYSLLQRLLSFCHGNGIV
jgi:hypothetical protein